MLDEDIIYRSGTIPGAGTYKCTFCGEEITIADGEVLPVCPVCFFEEFLKIA